MHKKIPNPLGLRTIIYLDELFTRQSVVIGLLEPSRAPSLAVPRWLT
jgi:hypothetical protein